MYKVVHKEIYLQTTRLGTSQSSCRVKSYRLSKTWLHPNGGQHSQRGSTAKRGKTKILSIGTGSEAALCVSDARRSINLLSII